jgi:hypothetical protein
MSSHLTHERCSELLADYLAGELDHEQHRLVEDHLEHCAQCSVERAGLAALRSADEDGGLTGDERAMLRAGVLEAIRESDSATDPLRDESDAVVVPLGGRGARAGKYLGIAAILAILAVGSVFVFGGGELGITGGDDSDSSFGTLQDSGGEGGGAEGAPAENRAEESFAYDAGNLRPRVQSDRGAISEGDLDRLARESVNAIATGLTSDTDPEESEPPPNELLAKNRASDYSLARLAVRAPETLARDVTECGRTALEELDRPSLATYATTATLEGEDVVIIAFVSGARRPDRYAVFAFPRGDCTTILTSSEGPLE